MTPLRGYFKTSAGIFAAGHFRGLGESFCNHHLEGGLDARSNGIVNVSKLHPEKFSIIKR